jgi:hypothetical protein
MGEILRSMATAVADAQLVLDRSALDMAEQMGGQQVLRDPETGEAVDAEGEVTTTPLLIDRRLSFGFERDSEGTPRPVRLSALELGFTPTFYQFTETLVELKIALRLAKVGGRPFLTGASVDGAYASKYSYEAKYASTFRTRLVPVPPPLGLNESADRPVAGPAVSDKEIA